MVFNFSVQISPDDGLWTHGSDDSISILKLLSNPYDFVEVDLGHSLVDHFVILFREFTNPGGNSAYLIQGIEGTGLITIQYDLVQSLQLASQLASSDTPEVDNLVRFRTDFKKIFYHNEWGTDPAVVAARLFQAATDPLAYLANLNSMIQVVTEESSNSSGVVPRPDLSAAFQHPVGRSIQFCYEGNRQWFLEPAANTPLPMACNVGGAGYTGTPGNPTNAVVDEVIVKMYA